MTDDYGFHLEVTDGDPDDPYLDEVFADSLEGDRLGCVVIVIGPQHIELTVGNAPPGLSLHEPAALAVEFLRDGHLKAGEVLHVCWDELPAVRARGCCAPPLPSRRSA